MKITKIIVEGADQQGKTVLCNFLSESLGWPVKHYGPPRNGFNFYSDYFIEKNSISDRNFLSEMCYRKASGLNHRIKHLGSLQHDMKGTLLIYVDKFNDFIFKDREELFSEEVIRRVRKTYREELLRVKLPVLIVKPSVFSNEVTLTKIKKLIHE